ncbi:MAG TPA: outer membrane beta-barrel protein [Sphingobacteriaceae bacterium]|nr:outer membrane beta-barrel protein [Sphingobacteriaceae bacterium]
MKKLVILAVATLFSGASMAQQKTGLKVGVNLPKYSYGADNANNGETGTTTNFHVTGYIDRPLSTNFSIQPGISLQGKGGRFVNTTNFEVEENTMWIEVPVNLLVKAPVGTGGNFFFGGGPYGALAIAGQRKTETNTTKTETDIEFGDENGDDLKGSDFGVNLLGGFQMSSGLNLSAGYGLGLTDLRPNSSGGQGKQTNRVLSFSVGFSF